MQIKRNVLAAGLVAGSLAMGAAHAIDMSIMNDMYVGFDVDKTSIAFTTLEQVDYARVYQSVFTAMTPYIGYEIYPAFALELGYFNSTYRPKTVNTIKGSVPIRGTSNAKVTGWYLDALTEYNVWEGLDLMGGIGIERLQFAVNNVNTSGYYLTPTYVLGADQQYVGRVSLGLGYNFTKHVSTRFMVRANNATLKSTAHYVMHYALGLQYAL